MLHNRPTRPAPRARRRAGLGLFELIVTATLLGTLAIVALPIMGGFVQADRTLQQRELALREAHNLLERLSLLPWDDLTSEKISTWKPAAEISRQLPGLEWQISLIDVPARDQPNRGQPDLDTPSVPAAKRLDVEVRWPEAAGYRAAAPLRLTSWRYAPGRPTP